MDIVMCIMIPIVAVVTLMAAVMGYKMGKGELRGILPAKSRAKQSEEKRKADIIAGNIERYDGTSVGQREVK